ncbi:futalosine hydrolase [Streptomyces sp. NPDC006208]|uniref:futalosine hydrolase n=1 Tax=Streptomyces sp. NPDC006208 TaxID=3156734 RepID=UPI0033AE92CF
MRVLVVTAVTAEADSVAAAFTGAAGATHRVPLPGGYALTRFEHAPGQLVDVLVAGVGPAAAAAGTAAALTAAVLGPVPATAPTSSGSRTQGSPAPYDLVVSTGIGGGFAAHAPLGSLVVSDAIVAADLGAQTPDGYLPVDELGFGRSVHHPPAELSARLAKTLDAVYAPVLTVSTVTGSAARAAELTARHPHAAAEAMEGFGVAEAATAHGVPVVEIRAVSNAVGPRDRAAWRIGEALDALRSAFQQLAPVLEESP